jgi:hypothetical protein
MTYKFDKVVDGIAKYINSEIYKGMNDVQEFLSRIVVGRLIENQEHIKRSLIDNGVVRSMGYIDSEGMVDVDTLMIDVKREIERKGKLEMTIPMIGKLTFVPDDVAILHGFIKGDF